jgi:hypothetical protein
LTNAFIIRHIQLKSDNRPFSNLAMIYNMVVLYPRPQKLGFPMPSSASHHRHDSAVANLEARFRAHGWQVYTAAGAGPFRPDLVVSKETRATSSN